MPKLPCNGFELHYAISGVGVPLVFLNGLAGDHLYWAGQVRTFSKEFLCLALDNRDAGQSSYAESAYSISDLADDVFHLLGSLGLPPAHVVGLSLGGMIAQELALRHPQAVRSLALIGTLARPDAWFLDLLDAFGIIRRHVADSGAFFEAVLPWLVSHRFYQESGRAEWLKALLRQSPYPQRIDGFFRQFDAIRRHDALDRLGNVRCRVLVAVGEHDAIIPPRYSHELAARLPHAQLRVLPGVGHAPPLEAPREFNRMLLEFLRDEP
ncbi:MAG: alpha/beta fold hydrolase [Gemmataceae bacterium]|nr:alpha/beta fold hydrolase [Gemmataceae bacterium]MDW8265751.1 alpha/beta fold hydrolase [Gemmataceae bacterium]